MPSEVSLSLSQAKNIFTPMNINSIVILLLLDITITILLCVSRLYKPTSRFY